jgi:uncharacterized protein (TIGR02996 family)
VTAIPPSPAPVPVAAAYTSDGDNMLRAVLAAPEDDAPRLEYADWLDERGQAGDTERAEFIRVQCELARAPERPACDCDKKRPGSPCAADPWDLEYSARKDRERDLLERHGHDWIGRDWASVVNKAPALSVPNGWNNDMFTFARGFVASVALPAAAFVGGPCESCNGSGCAPEFRGILSPCPDCNRGMTPGLAAALFAAHPVTEVRLADRVPLEFDGRFLWHNGDSPLSTEQDYGDHLPAALFKLLEGNIRRPGRVTEVVKSYATAEAAQSALSRTCVAYGRSLAPLPALALT